MSKLVAQVFAVVFLVYCNTPTTYSQNSTSAHSIQTLDNFIALVEKIERHSLAQNKPMKVIANYIRKLAYNDDKWTTLLGTQNDMLPDSILTSYEKGILTSMVNHRMNGRNEQGVVHTPFGDVAMGRVITGICAGISRNKSIMFPQLLHLTAKTMDNLFAATIAGDLGIVSLTNPITSLASVQDPGGYWSPTSQCPQNFYLYTSYNYNTSFAKIRGAVDGFLLGYKLAEWNNLGVRLGQLLRMYYHDGVVYDNQFAACTRMETLKKIMNTSMLTEQTTLAAYATKLVWKNSLDFSSVYTSNIPHLAYSATMKFQNLTNNTAQRYSCPERNDEGCSFSANIVFVLDESGSIGYSNYQIEKQFVKKIIGAFDISSYQTRVSVVEYASYAYETIKLGDYSSKSALMCAVDQLGFADGGTYTSQALQVASNILTNEQSQRPASDQINNLQIVILLTDGHSNGGVAALRPVVESIKANITGLTMIAVGVGGYNKAELDLIATDPSKHVFNVNDFSKLINLAKSLQSQTCETPTVLKPLSQNGNISGGDHVTGYVSPGKTRYFTVDSDTLYHTKNFTVQIKPTYGTLDVYGSRSNATPGEDSHDFKYKAGEVHEFYDACKGYNSSNCPPLYMSIVGRNSSNACFDRDCAVPNQIKYEVKTVGYGFCLNRPCQNGGLCEDTPYGYNCACPPGYSGRQCQTDLVVPAECKHYTNLSDGDRAKSSPMKILKCDQYSLPVNWYRFTGAAGSAMPTKCVAKNHCGTHAPGWLSGPQPTSKYQLVTSKVCYHWGSSCCLWSNYIPIRNCDSFYVYQLVKTPYCHLRYCGNGSGSGEYYCMSRPCQNNGTCQGTPYGYNCTCQPGYSGNACQTKFLRCSSNPCRNGGTCLEISNGFYCNCSIGHFGQYCESFVKPKVTCNTTYMEVELTRSLYPNIDWRNFHLIDVNCRATDMTLHTVRLRTALNGCGTNHTEHNDMLEFWNLVMFDNRYYSSHQSLITRQSTELLRFYCKYSRRQLVSTSFSPAKETYRVSEGNFGNFTFLMHMFKTSDYNNMYSLFDYPVKVTLNEPLWVQFQVANADSDLVVFADSCYATTSVNSNSYPRYEFLKSGCVLDSTMVYNYNSSSSIQKFTIKSFRFIQDNNNNNLVYMHCELMVCHRFSTNSRCSRGCINNGRKRREAQQYDDTSKEYDLSTGPIDITKTDANNDNQGSQDTVQGMAIGFGVLGALFIAVCVVVAVKIICNKWTKPSKREPAPTVTAYDGPAALQLDEIAIDNKAEFQI